MKKRSSNFKFILLCFVLIAMTLNSQIITGEEFSKNTCVTCHTELEYLPSDLAIEDVHIDAGLSCVVCHGGNDTLDDGEESMSKKNGFIGIPTKAEIPGICGKCHSSIEYMRTFRPRIATDQVSQYYTSLHGIKLLEGDDNVATCTNCHTAHSIYTATDPRSSVYALNIPETCNQCHGNKDLMNQYGLQANQYSKFSQSVHGVALLKNKDTGAPACNDCHGNHGAMPPEVTSISHVCGTCHLSNMEYFQQSPMAELENSEFHACEQCHGHHDIQRTSDAFLGEPTTSVCLDCHSSGDEGIVTSKVMYDSISSLNNDCDSIEADLKQIKVIGMNDIEISYILQEARQQVIESRTSIHSFDTSIVLSKTRKGNELVKKGFALATREFEEYNERKDGFLYATIAFLLLGAGVFLKIRYYSAAREE